MVNKIYVDVALLKFEEGEYEDHEIGVINALDSNIAFSDVIKITKEFLSSRVREGATPSYTGMDIFLDYWKDGKLHGTKYVGNVANDYDDTRDGLPVLACDWENGESEYFYPYE